jgi:hypothetical protein
LGQEFFFQKKEKGAKRSPASAGLSEGGEEEVKSVSGRHRSTGMRNRHGTTSVALCVTPAIEAGFTDHIWLVEELLTRE